MSFDYDAAGLDRDEFEEIRQHAERLKEDHGDLDALMEEMNKLWLLEWGREDQPKKQGEDVKLTVSPDAPNHIVGAQRLLTAAEPKISIAKERNSKVAFRKADALERVAGAMWHGSGRIQGRPVEKEAVLSSLLYGRMDLNLVNLLDALKDADKTEKAHYRRVKRATQMTPILFEPVSPIGAYPEWDRFGLRAYYRRYRTSVRAAIEEWPDLKAELAGRKPEDDVWISDWYDLVWRILWIDTVEVVGQTTAQGTRHRETHPNASADPFSAEKHELLAIPIVPQVIEGTRLLQLPHQQVRPFLYTVHKSGLYNRQNLALTALYTTVFAVAANAMFLYERAQGREGTWPDVDFSHIGAGIIGVNAGEKFTPLFSKGAIDPALVAAIEIAERKITESTISRQALGEPLGANAPYSMVALLHQAGRLPLVTPQMLAGWGIANALELAMEWLREDKRKIKVWKNNVAYEIGPKDIPEFFTYDVKLEIDLPQDWSTMAQIAQNLVALKVVSLEFVREKFLNVGQSVSMDEDIWAEEMSSLLALQVFQSLQELRNRPRAPEVGGGGVAAGAGNGAGAELPEIEGAVQPPENAPLQPRTMPGGA